MPNPMQCSNHLIKLFHTVQRGKSFSFSVNICFCIFLQNWLQSAWPFLNDMRLFKHTAVRVYFINVFLYRICHVRRKQLSNCVGPFLPKIVWTPRTKRFLQHQVFVEAIFTPIAVYVKSFLRPIHLKFNERFRTLCSSLNHNLILKIQDVNKHLS